MIRFFALALLAATIFAQSGTDPFNKPPAEVDKALRERVTEFFQDHVTGQASKSRALTTPTTSRGPRLPCCASRT